MNVNVSIGGVAASARMRALALVREAMAKREQQMSGMRPPPVETSLQQARGR